MSYQYTAIGDSLTTGFGALPGNGFVPVYRRMAEVRLREFVAYNNLGVNGLTSSELNQRVSRNPSFRQALKEADMITISIGGNDLIKASKAAQAQPSNTSRILRGALQECKQNFSSIISEVYRLKSGYGKPHIIRVVGLYNPYPRIGEATDWVQQFNRYAAQYSNQVYGFANIYPDFAGRERELLFLDHLHPNGRGYRTIAEHLNALGYGRLG
ncbi:GDSL-type esterase/lipase family protein [Paenibacillus physcomitrellae]|uniref:Spore germination lipase LipC n=1 Tax=Paenibacillus physcomitrellae TaxID=1619311 RepID=A0ABQ1GS93_9BACL|nr:GDSL-type esterase/lipase family protein [Paenibacillus physcomitrellae]GGA49423.1 spore germination lipase LipC [Paenibacillus physcomitrellae]